MSYSTDKILFILANDITDENVLAVLAALQNYEKAAYDKVKGWNSTHGQSRQIDLKVHIVYENERHYFIFESCLSHLASIKKTMVEVKETSFDCIIPVSIEVALKLASATNKPLADAIGIIIGGEGGTLPNVDNLCQAFSISVDTLYDFRFIDMYLRDRDLNLKLGISGVDTIGYAFNNTPMSLERRVLEVFKSKSIIGYSSFETYLGCALKKPVLEIQLNRHLYKWSNPNYVCLTEENQDAIVKGIQLCLQKICVESTMMEAGMSSVQDVLTT